MGRRYCSISATCSAGRLGNDLVTTSTERCPTAEQIAVRAQELKVLHLGLMLTQPSLVDPG
jgi:hypothetical protein